VVRHESASIEAGLSQLLDDSVLYNQLRQGCSNVLRDLSWEEPLTRMENLYRLLIGEERLA
jgi:hypothetical protein